MSPIRTTFTIRHYSSSISATARPPTVIEVEGELDTGSAPGFLAVVDGLADDRRIVLDLRACRLRDPGGLRLLAQAARLVGSGGGALTTLGGGDAAAAALSAVTMPSTPQTATSARGRW